MGYNVFEYKVPGSGCIIQQGPTNGDSAVSNTRLGIYLCAYPKPVFRIDSLL